MTPENEKSLMKKTKKELIDIISRKDDTEKKYVETIKSLEANVSELSDKVQTNELNEQNRANTEEALKQSYEKDIEELQEELRTSQVAYNNIKLERNELIDKVHSLSNDNGALRSEYFVMKSLRNIAAGFAIIATVVAIIAFMV